MENRTREKGWIRELIPDSIRGKKSLTVTERFALMFQYNLMACFQSNGGSVNSWTSIFADVWGVSRRNLSNYFDKYVHRGFCMERKDQNDKGKTVFNSEEKQKNMFTPLNIYKKNSHTDSEMIMGVWTWLTSSKICMCSIPIFGGFISRSHRER